MFDLLTREHKERLLAPLAGLVMNVEPNLLSCMGFGIGIMCAFLAACSCYKLALLCWICNRIVDGVDGVVARQSGKVTEFGGYLDIIFDFIVYGLVPVGLAISSPSYFTYLMLSVMLVTFFVNAAGLFLLSAILEKNNAGASSRNEMTGVTMVPALVEGTETVFMYSLFLLVPSCMSCLFALFAIGVGITIAQRLMFAYQTLDKPMRLDKSSKLDRSIKQK